MVNNENVKEFVDKFYETLPPFFKDSKSQFEKHFWEFVKNSLQDHIVTQEEFSVYKKMLKNTQKKLTELEKKLSDKK